MSENKTVLVLDGETRAALAVVRSLGRAGLKVVVASEYPHSLAGSSRYCCHSAQYPSQFKDTKLFLQSIRDLILNNSIDVLFPITDSTTYAILKHQQLFEKHISIPFVPFEKYWAASDKINLIRIGKELGIPIPESICIDPDKNNDLQNYLDTITFPVIIKPQASLIQNYNEIRKTNVRFASEREELIQIVNKDASFTKPYMLQNVISGAGIGVFAFCIEGEIQSVFSHHRIREKPPYGGVSVVCESTKPDPSALNSAKKLLEKLKWSGVAMVEFKRDSKRSNIPVLMEINARFWGSLQLAIDAGINFPLYQYYLSKYTEFKQTALFINKYEPEHTIQPKNNFKTEEKQDIITCSVKHSRSRWLLGDLDHLIIRLKTPAHHSRYSQRLPDKIVAIVLFFMEFFKGSKIEEFRYGDSGPFWHALKSWIKGL